MRPAPDLTARTLAGVVLVTAILAGCADSGDDELASLRAELERRAEMDDAVTERIDVLEDELAATQRALDRSPTNVELDALREELDELAERHEATLEGLVDDLTVATTTIETLEESVTAERGQRRELAGQLGAVEEELSSVAADLRSSVATLEADTAGLTDQLVALRDRVDVIQSQIQRMVR